jgi:hypothetical protein
LSRAKLRVTVAPFSGLGADATQLLRSRNQAGVEEKNKGVRSI